MSSPNRSPRGSSQVGLTGFLNISDLAPNSKGWIRGKLTGVNRKPYKSGQGELLVATLTDSSCSIKLVVFFNDIATFENMFQEGAWVRINGYVMSDGLFGKQIKINRSTSIFPTDAFEIPQATINFVNFEDARSKPDGEMIAVVGVVFEAMPVNIFTAASGKDVVKRHIILIDQTEMKLELVIWGEDAQKFNGKKGDSLLVNKGRIKIFRDELTIIVFASDFELNSTSNEATTIKKWFEAQNI